MRTVACTNCGQEFQSPRKEQRYCSRKCANSRNNRQRTVICAYCGKEFQTYKKDQRYCGHSCASFVISPQRGHKCISIRVCEYCGEEYELEYKPNQRFCSKKCASSATAGMRPKDITGQRFGKLIAIEHIGKDGGGRNCWRCKCDCGNETKAKISSLMNGDKKSCGCLAQEQRPNRNNPILFDGTNIAHITQDKLRSNNTSGVTGVSKSKGKWIAHIGLRGKVICLGTYEKKEDAVRARRVAEEKYFQPVIEEYHAFQEAEGGGSHG